MKRSILKRIFSYLRSYRGSLVLGCISAVLQVAFTLMTPVLIGRAIDCLIGPGLVQFRHLAVLLAAMALCILLAAGFQWVMNVCIRRISALAAQDMRQQAFDALNAVPISTIDQLPHGDLVSRLVNDTDAVSEGLLQGLTQLLPGAATILGVLVIMFYLNPFIALVVVLVTPLSILFARFVASRTHALFRKQAAAQGQLSAYVNEMVNGQDLVKAFGHETQCCKTFDRINEELRSASLWAVFYSAAANPGTRFVNNIVYGAVGVFGGLAALSGALSVGTLSAFLTYANQYTKPFNEVTSVLTQLQTAMASAQRLFQTIDLKPEPADAPGALAPERCSGRVELDRVDFSYRKDVPLIQNLCLKVEPGQRIAIVGPTGCGKTTLINLLMRFYEVDSGRILVDGVPARQLKRSALRGMYGMVLQETWLKNATVRENIAYGKPDATMEQIIQAAKAAHAHGFIQRLPQGYDTLIAPGGGNLSAGQKQLLCIARILLCRPQMLILDEATSNIDTRTEMLVQQAFEQLMEGRTSFVVAHRLSTIQTADQILVMDAGHIVEQGTHRELLAKGGFYARLYNSQFAIQ